MKTILNLDDFYSCNHGIPKLDRLNAYFDNFKVTVFAIPDCLPDDWVKMDVLTRPYIQLALHGAHHLFHECANWDFVTAVKAITEAEQSWTVRGFKAPFWIDSTGTLKACKKLGYWAALNCDHEPPYGNLPEGLKIYYHTEDISNIPENFKGEYLKLHGHIQDVCGNGLGECFDNIIKLPKDTEFMWIDDYVKETGGDSLPWSFRKDIPYDCYKLAMHEYLGGTLTQDNVETLWDLTKQEGGPVLEVGGKASSVIFGIATGNLVVTIDHSYAFDFKKYTQEHNLNFMLLGSSKDPKTLEQIPKDFKAQILFVDNEDSKVPVEILSFIKDGGLIISKTKERLIMQRKE